MVNKEEDEDCRLSPAMEPSSCYFPSSSTPLAELETVRSLEIVESSSLSPVWYCSMLNLHFLSGCHESLDFEHSLHHNLCSIEISFVICLFDLFTFKNYVGFLQ